MGVFNHTCAITRTPLRDGARCRVVILASTMHYDKAGVIPPAICGVGEIFKPVDRPFICRYNDDDRLPEFDEGHPDEEAFWDILKGFGVSTDRDQCFRDLASSKFMFEGHQITYCFISEVVFEKLDGEFQRLYKDIDDYLMPFWKQKRHLLENSPDRSEDEEDAAYYATMKRMHLKSPLQFFKDHIHFNEDLSNLNPPREFMGFIGWGVVQSSTRHHLIPFAKDHDDFPVARLRDAAQIWVLSEYLQAIRGCWMNQAGQGNQDFNDSNQYELLVEMIQGAIAAQKFEENDNEEGEDD